MDKCIICRTRIKRWRGNFNVHKTPICDDPKCKRKRKTQLQSARRRSK